MLLDRVDERAALDRLLENVRSGLSGVLVLRGEPGIGKTALLDYAAEVAADMQVARVTAVESEMELDFAGLHLLLAPFLPLLVRLPATQRRALSSALGLTEGATRDRFLVGLATLTLLAEAATERPLLILVDDAQWLDRESADVVAFVARRLEADRIGLLFTVREPVERRLLLEGLPELHVLGLPDEDARELLQSIAAGPVDRRVSAALLAATRGNALGLVELAAELSRSQLAGTALLPDPLPIGSRLEECYLRQVRALPSDSQLFVLLAAADPSGDPRLLWQAAERLGIDRRAAEPAEAERLLVLRPTIAFRHPLIRSAAYGAAPAPERRRVHAALAAASDPAHDRDRRAWHDAMAALGPDELVAAELERSAERARRRGGYAAAADFLVRAAALTPDPERGAARLVDAAQAEVNAGTPASAQGLLEQASPYLIDRFQQARALRLEGAIRWALGQLGGTSSLLLRAAALFEDFDLRLARATMLEAVEAALYAGRLGSGGTFAEIAECVRAAPHLVGRDGTVVDELLSGFTTLTVAGHAAAAPPLRRAAQELANEQLGPEESLPWMMLGCLSAGVLLDDSAEHAIATTWVRLARAEGALTTLPVALNYLGWYEVQAGRFAVAEALLLERREIAAATGNPGVVGPAGAGELLLATWRGREPEARAAAEAMTADSLERSQGAAITHALSALAVLELGLGRYESALAHARDVYEEDAAYLGTLVLPDLVEAGTRSGDLSAAKAARDRLAERALASGTQRALGLLARSRALVADFEEAEPLYEESSARLNGTRVVTELARSHLVFGEWLRRRRRRSAARHHLLTAFRLFDQIGAEAFGERAHGELLATGERAARRSIEPGAELTPQEARVAQLAADGATNSEIAAQLFISPSTVEYHLRKVFRKLGVRSRTQLARVMLAAESAARFPEPIRSA